MIIKSLTWCQYAMPTTTWFGKNQADRYLLPGQAVPLTSGTLLKQALAWYTDNELLITNIGNVDADDVVRKVQYEQAFLPFKETGLSTLEYCGKNYPMVGFNDNPFIENLPQLTQDSLMALNWVKTAGGLIEVQEPHRLWVAVEASAAEKATQVWCPINQTLVRLKPVDVPIVFAPLNMVVKNTIEEGWLVQNTPDKDKKWWVWNAAEMARKDRRATADREQWLNCSDLYVNTTGKLPEATGSEFYRLTDGKFRRLSIKKMAPPAGKFAQV